MKTRSWNIDVFDEPDQQNDYVIGGDPAGGMANSTYSAAIVMDSDHMRVAAVLHSKIDPDEYARAVEALGYVYNEALICIERNRDGQGINSYLLNEGYPNLYFGKENKIRGQTIDARPGVYLGKQNRRTVINLLAGVVNNKQIDIPHQKTIEELSMFIKDDKGEGHAQEGYYDDLVFALAYAIIAHTESGYDRKFKGGVEPKNESNRLAEGVEPDTIHERVNDPDLIW